VNVSTVKKSPHATDRHVGSRVRMRRKMQGMTQEKLGQALKHFPLVLNREDSQRVVNERVLCR
jgi:transcriptional regulator with XRE-family HTH domain